MHQKKLDWNSSYSAERDYQWTKTSQLTHVLTKTGVSTSDHVLDIGCGTGQLCRDLFHRGYTVMGVDVSSEAVRIAKSSTIFNEGISFEVANIEDCNLTVTQFGMVFCKYVLAFISDRDKFIEYTNSLLIKDGVLVLINPDIDTLPPQKKSITLEHSETLELLNSVYTSVESELVGNEYYYYARK